MADKTISVSLDFSANTSSAENSLRALQTSLQNITNMSQLNTSGTKMTKEILEASEAAIQLRAHLQAAMDVNTGKLNLSKLDSELKASGMKLSDYASKLAAIGPQGQQAFMQMADAIIASQTPLRQTNALIDKLWDGLKRTMGWQLSSSVIHGFMGAIQSAYGYAQDLNQSLNNIRIVTGASVDEMSKFAEQANKSAKALSTTTTDYTDAALIYYQQGIRDQNEIAERVAVTTKLANVSRQSAEEVSSQMTAIWNNFDDGSHSLEYYADVITALGAATASSSQEISRGLQQFAATAQTVGLSYEYATSALATIVATTRQSADTVGTGLRTLFARLEGLKLGKTLEDGVDLNKYSKALNDVGVQVLDATGNLKDMDTILEDLAGKWDNLDRAQKMALAQTVGGVRQYNNLIALMDNWDFMQENLNIATDSEGALQEQQDIYAEGWEAAQKRVRTSAEALYTDLLNDKFFIDITNIFGGFLDILDKVIDRLGGMGTILPGLVILIDKLFGPKIQAGAKEIWHSLTSLSISGQAKQAQADQAVKNATIDAVKGTLTTNDQSQAAQTATREYGKVVDLQQKMVNNAEKMSAEEQRIAQLYVDRQKQIADGNIEQAKRVDLLKQEQELILAEASEHYPEGQVDLQALTQAPKEEQSQFVRDMSKFSTDSYATDETKLKILKEYGLVSQDMIAHTAEADQAIAQYTNKLDNLAADAFPNLIEKYATVIQEQQEFGNSLDSAFQNATNVDDLKNKITELAKGFDLTTDAGQKLQKELARADGGAASFSRIKKAAMDCFNEMQKGPKNIKQIEKALRDLGVSESYLKKVKDGTISLADAQTELAHRIELSKNSMQGAGQAFSNFNGGLQKGLSNFSKFAQGASTAVMAVSMIKNAVETLQSPDATGWEKFSTVIMSLGMAVPVAVNAFNGFANAVMGSNAVTNLAIAAAERHTGAVAIEGAAIAATVTKQEVETAVAGTGYTVKQLIAIARQKNGAAAMAEALGVDVESLSEEANAAATWLDVAAKNAQKLAMLGVVGAAVLLVGAIIGITAAVINANNAEKQAEENNKKVNETYETRIEILEKTKTAAEEVKKSFDDMTEAAKKYGDAREALAGMEKGTESYRDKVKEANDAARELVKTMGLTLGKGYDIVDGEYIINKGSDEYKTAYANQQQKIKTAEQVQMGFDYAQADAYRDKLEGEQVNIAAKSTTTTKWDEAGGSEYTETNITQDSFNIGPAELKQILADMQKQGITDAEAYINQQYNAGKLFAGKEMDSKDLALVANQISEMQSAQEGLHQAYEGQIVNAAMQANPNMAPYLTTEMIQSTLGDTISANMEEFDQKVEEKLTDKYVADTIKDLFPDGYEMTQDQKDRGLSQAKAEREVAAARATGEIAQEYIKQALPELKASAQQAVLDNATQTAYIKDLPTEEEFALSHPDLDNIEEEYNYKIEKAYEKAQEAFTKLLDSDTITNYAKNQASGDSEEYAAEYDAAKEKASDTRDWDFQDWENENLVEQFIKEKEAAGYAKEEIYEYVQAMKDLSMTEEEVAEQQERRNALMSEAQQYGIDPEDLSNYIDAFEDYNMELAQGEGTLTATDQAAEQAALRYARLNKGVQDVAKNTDDYVAVLKASKKATDAVSKANLKNEDSYKDLRKSLANILNTSEDLVDIDFMQNLNPADLKALAQGGDAAAAALDRIQSQFIETQAKAAGFSEGLTSALQQVNTAAEGIDLTQILTDEQVNELITKTWAISSSMEDFQNRIKGMDLSLDITPLTESMRAAAEASLQEGEVIVDAFSFDGQPVTSEASATSTTEEMGYTVEYIPGSRVPAPAAVLTDADSETATPVDAYYTPVTKKVTFTPEKEEATTTEPIVAYKMSNGHHSSGGNIAPPVSKGKSGGGGGGGGGGGSKKSKDAPKADRGARYHNVTRRQSNVSRQQTENNRRKDRAFGKAQVELAREDLEIQKKKIELQEEYTKEISKNLKEDREDMKKQFEALQLPINFKFDEDGEIENYQEIIDALFEKEKALVEQYNSGGLDDEAFDEAKKKLDEAKEALGNYEETLELQKDELQTLEEYMEELADKALELTQIKFELNMSIIEDQLEWLDYSLSKLENDAYGAAQAMALIGQQTSAYLKESEVVQNAINEILSRHGINSLNQLNGLSDAEIEALGFNKNEIDTLKEYRSKLYDINNALLEFRRTLVDQVLDTFDKFNEKVERSYDQFEHYSNVLESFNDIVDLLGVKTDVKTRELLKTIQTTQLNNLKNQAVSAKSIYEGALADYELAKQRYKEAKTRYGDTSVEAQQMEEIMNEMADKRDESYENWLDVYSESLQKAREIYEAEMEQLERDFEESLTGIYGVFDLFDAAYERTKNLRDNYIPEYEKIYELNKLNRDIQKEIDNSNSLRDRKALRQLQEEINNKQAAGVQLSKYEVEEMRKKFELEQARINLEEARNNKSEVRLTRDQNGNWGYVYTAAEDKVADAEQKYEDALYQYQKLSDDYINELDGKIKNLANNTKEEINGILEAFNEGLIDENQRDEQISQVMDGFYKQRDYLLSQFNTVSKNLSGSLGLMQEIFGQEGNLIDNFNETITGITSKTTDIKEFFKQNEISLDNYIQGVIRASKVLKETNEEIANQNQLHLGQITEEVKKLDELSNTTKNTTKTLVQDLSNSFKTVMDELQTWDQQYGMLLGKAIQQNDAFIISLNNMLTKLRDIASYEMKDLYDQIDLISGKASRGETITDEDWKKLDALRNKYFVQASAEKFDTGGYTGDWGTDGKLAVLHQKEYILDENLTNRFFNALNDISAYENSLITTQETIAVLHDAVTNIQNISNTIGMLAERMNAGGILDNWLNTSVLSNINTNDQLEQNVHIDATFPNVQDHNEIEMAFDNLVNKASQYANRKDLSSMTFQDSYLNQF